jgi:hypothetical protein
VVATVESSSYFLVTVGRDNEAVLVFLGTPPAPAADGIPPTPVTLEQLPVSHRFGLSGGVAMGRPLLGRWPGSHDRFRQFLTYSEMVDAGWLHVPRYRICDTWEDYFCPWAPPTALQATVNGLLDDGGVNDTAAGGPLPGKGKGL